jgi:hypothetical protein
VDERAAQAVGQHRSRRGVGNGTGHYEVTRPGLSWRLVNSRRPAFERAALIDAPATTRGLASPEFNAWRAQKNAEISRETAWKRGNALRGSGMGKGYLKLLGRHAHRVIAETMLLDRELFPGEVVHHINGDKHDNRPQNLEVLPSQAVHASIHGRRRHEGK